MSYNESLNADSNYPPMSQSQWDNAPFNQKDPPERLFDISLSISLSKDASVYSSNYDPEGKFGMGELDNPLEAYKEYNHTIPELLGILKKLAREKLSESTNQTASYIHRWKSILED